MQLLKVHINESRPLKFVKTPSLRSGNEISKNRKFGSFSNSDKQKQFAQYLGGKESDGLSGQFVVQYDVERDPYGGEVLLQDGYFIHFFAPSDLEPLPKHVVFVLDTSGSMGGTKLSQLKDAMKSILSELRTEDIVNIIEFNTWALVWDINNQNTSGLLGLHGNYEEPLEGLYFNKWSFHINKPHYQSKLLNLKLKLEAILSNSLTQTEREELKLPAPTPVNFETISKAKHIIDKIFATGMTNIIEGLETALYLVKVGQENNAKQTDKKYQPIVIFLTDGEPNVGMASTEQIISTVTKLNSQNNNVPIFSLSFGYGADKEFLKKLSLKNQGFTRHIYEASDASLQLQEFYKQISSPLLSNVNFKYEDEVQHVTRRHFPIYFRGSELVVAGKYKDPSLPIKVTCWGPRGPLDLRPIVAKPVTSLERLWAYLTVKQTDSAENKTELTKKALDLALKYSFVTDVTSLVVVKPNDTSAVDTEEATKVRRTKAIPTCLLRVGGGTYSQSYAGLTSSYQTSGQTYHGRADMPLPTRAYAYPQSYAGLTSSYRTSSLRSRAFYQPSAGYNVGLNRFPGYRPSLYMPSYNVGTYELGDNSLAITNNDMCLNTPLNATGVCIPLKDCTEVYSYLTDFQVYQQYFCALENR
ncbi:hypothetical protein NQ318_001458 [Aromia moschata]|uniref:VWFA domain-containing protein n=1 Tax=Aromia moschata TaxID=1265417 RepID=A0AAV8YWT4_9CUCU|nr:hypothetical protein NQ318_001458 [Aromia moschata]